MSYARTRVTRVPIEHPSSPIHVNILDLGKQGEYSRLPEAIVGLERIHPSNWCH